MTLTTPKTFWSILFKPYKSSCRTTFTSWRKMFTKLSCFTQFKMKVNELIENINMNEDSITGIAKNLKPNKSNGWDNLSIRIIKICGQSIPYPLKLIFIDSLRGGIFLEFWKKANIVPVHKKEDKILTNSYRTISLLPIFVKMLERFIFKDLFNRFSSLPIRFFTRWLMDLLTTFFCAWDKFNIWLCTDCWCQKDPFWTSLKCLIKSGI